MVAEWRTGKQAPEGSLKERLDMKCSPSFLVFPSGVAGCSWVLRYLN